MLEVDLTSRRFSILEPKEDLYLNNLGGRGLAGGFLWEKKGLEWDDPQMPVVFATGPLVGTRAPTSGRMAIASRSPLTGAIGDTSVGGGLGTQMKRAGWDAIIVTGKSVRPLGLIIDTDNIEITEATKLVGKPLSSVARELEALGSFAVIGPAAENNVFFATVMVDRHFAAGRGGLGLSLFKKGLKFIAIRGRRKLQAYDPKGLEDAREKIFRQSAASSILQGPFGLASLGTPALYDLIHVRRMMPTSNFRKTFFPLAPKMNAYNLEAAYKPLKSGCRGCHIQCKRLTNDSRPVPEFETLSHFSALLNNTDLETVVQANKICNDMGMDTISAASALSCHQEIIGNDLGPAGILQLLTDIALARTSLGQSLGRGSRAYAQSRGKSGSSMSVKGMDLPAYDPRGAYGMALAYVTSTRGGCHLRAYPIGHEILLKPVATDRFSFAGKARMIKIAEDVNATIDSLTACKFLFFATSLEEYSKALTAITGIVFSENDLQRTGERIYFRERMYNAHAGFSSRDDDLPERFFKEPGSSGAGIEIPPIDRGEFLEARSRYYKARGLDENGMPLKEKIRELGL
ncbi:MAG: aldehyde ferredoxin oxidoreductase [Deltaproteobacteria bacterium]|nr:aldehyde ferredoxin oxidoreductase [Deltaproteobacteria bacterium]